MHALEDPNVADIDHDVVDVDHDDWILLWTWGPCSWEWWKSWCSTHHRPLWSPSPFIIIMALINYDNNDNDDLYHTGVDTVAAFLRIMFTSRACVIKIKELYACFEKFNFCLFLQPLKIAQSFPLRSSWISPWKPPCLDSYLAPVMIPEAWSHWEIQF